MGTKILRAALIGQCNSPAVFSSLGSRPHWIGPTTDWCGLLHIQTMRLHARNKQNTLNLNYITLQKRKNSRLAIQSTVSVIVSFEQSENPLKDCPVENFQRLFVKFVNGWHELGQSVQLDHSLITHSPGHFIRHRSGVAEQIYLKP